MQPQTKDGFQLSVVKPNQLKVITLANHKQGFAGKKVKFRGIFGGKFAEKTADFAGISEASFAEKRSDIGKERPISWELPEQISLESNWFCADLTKVFNETRHSYRFTQASYRNMKAY